VTWSYYAEFQPKARRGAMLSFLAAFWMVGNFVVAGNISKQLFVS
jgi:VNT family MFS transporter (synaptic vesicle glycoprotein 2)